MHTGQIKEKLSKGHSELRKRGICQSEFVEKRRGDWEVIYTSLESNSRQTLTSSHPLVKELSSRGIKRPSSLVKNIPGERILDAIENYDDRLAHGETIGPGWLRDCLTEPSSYDFRRGYLSKRKRATQKKLRVDQDKQKESAKLLELTVKRSQQAERRKAFTQFYEALATDQERESFAERAIDSNRFLKDFIHESLRRGELAKAKRYEIDAMLILWEQERIKAA